MQEQQVMIMPDNLEQQVNVMPDNMEQPVAVLDETVNPEDLIQDG